MLKITEELRDQYKNIIASSDIPARIALPMLQSLNALPKLDEPKPTEETPDANTNS